MYVYIFGGGVAQKYVSGNIQSRSKSRSGSRFSCRGKEENLLAELFFDLL